MTSVRNNSDLTISVQQTATFEYESIFLQSRWECRTQWSQHCCSTEMVKNLLVNQTNESFYCHLVNDILIAIRIAVIQFAEIFRPKNITAEHYFIQQYSNSLHISGRYTVISIGTKWLILPVNPSLITSFS